MSNLKTYDDAETIRLGNGFAESSINLIKVSGGLIDQDQTITLDKTENMHEPHFQLIQSFSRT